MDPVLYVVAMVSFLLGSFGYVMVRFLLLPIFRYKRLKREVRKALRLLEKELNASSEKIPKSGKQNRHAKTLRRLSSQLSDHHTNSLPQWYKLLLEGRRNEFAIEAAKHLMTLSNTRAREHAVRNIEKIRMSLNLKK